MHESTERANKKKNSGDVLFCDFNYSDDDDGDDYVEDWRVHRWRCLPAFTRRNDELKVFRSFPSTLAVEGLEHLTTTI